MFIELFKLILLTLLGIIAVNGSDLKDIGDRPLVRTSLGDIVGVREYSNGKPINVYYGIPYAVPPVNSLRFERPRKLHKFDQQPYDASQFKPHCQQRPHESKNYSNVIISEDCLYMNIWTPASLAKEFDQECDCKPPVKVSRESDSAKTRDDNDDYDGRLDPNHRNSIVEHFNHALDSINKKLFDDEYLSDGVDDKQMDDVQDNDNSDDKDDGEHRVRQFLSDLVSQRREKELKKHQRKQQLKKSLEQLLEQEKLKFDNEIEDYKEELESKLDETKSRLVQKKSAFDRKVVDTIDKLFEKLNETRPNILDKDDSDDEDDNVHHDDKDDNGHDKVDDNEHRHRHPRRHIIRRKQDEKKEKINQMISQLVKVLQENKEKKREQLKETADTINDILDSIKDGTIIGTVNGHRRKRSVDEKDEKDEKASDDNCTCTSGKKYPVLFYIFGGLASIYQQVPFEGEPPSLVYNGQYYASDYNAIVVTVNFRQGAYANLYIPEENHLKIGHASGFRGNNGLFDQVIALELIKNNIEAFGGDPKRITLFGNSLGAVQVGLHTISPYSNQLFKNAILQSGAPLFNPVQLDSKEEASQRSLEYAKSVGCTRSVGKLPEKRKLMVDLECLKKLKVDQLDDADSGMVHRIFFDDEFIPLETRLRYQLKNEVKVPPHITILAGLTSDEDCSVAIEVASKNPEATGATLTTPPKITKRMAEFTIISMMPNQLKLFAPKAAEYYTSSKLNLSRGWIDSVADFDGDLSFNCPIEFYCEALALNGNRVYNYYLTQRPTQHYASGLRAYSLSDAEWTGPCHADEIFFVFGTPFKYSKLFSQHDRHLSAKIMYIWSEFARNSVPPSVLVVDPAVDNATVDGKHYYWPSAAEDGTLNYVQLIDDDIKLNTFEFQMRCKQFWKQFGNKMDRVSAFKAGNSDTKNLAANLLSSDIRPLLKQEAPVTGLSTTSTVMTIIFGVIVVIMLAALCYVLARNYFRRNDYNSI